MLKESSGVMAFYVLVKIHLVQGGQFRDGGGNWSVCRKPATLGKPNDKFSNTRICLERDLT